MRNVLSSDIDMSLDADNWSPESRAELTECVDPGEESSIPAFEKDDLMQHFIVRKVNDRLAAELPISRERTQMLRALLIHPGRKEGLKCATKPGMATHIQKRSFRLCSNTGTVSFFL